jgi:hypothetical protein
MLLLSKVALLLFLTDFLNIQKGVRLEMILQISVYYLLSLPLPLPLPLPVSLPLPVPVPLPPHVHVTRAGRARTEEPKGPARQRRGRRPGPKACRSARSAASARRPPRAGVGGSWRRWCRSPRSWSPPAGWPLPYETFDARRLPDLQVTGHRDLSGSRRQRDGAERRAGRGASGLGRGVGRASAPQATTHARVMITQDPFDRSRFIGRANLSRPRHP